MGHILLQNRHPVVGHISCCKTHPVAGHTPYCKTCILSKDVHPVEGYASCCKTHILLKDRHPLAKHASSCRTCILLQNRHPVKGHASCQSVENKEVCFCVCVWVEYFIVPLGKSRLPYPGKSQQMQEQCYPLLSVGAVFLLIHMPKWSYMAATVQDF